MKLTKLHTDLLADVKAGKVWRVGQRSIVERADSNPGGPERDVTVIADTLHREYLIVPGRADVPDPKRSRRQWRLTRPGEGSV